MRTLRRGMRTLIISDLHLGSRLRRDVLRQPGPRRVLLDELANVDRLVLLGDIVELLEGRQNEAMDAAEPVLRAVGDAMGRGREILVIPGNHDHLLVRPWLRARRAQAAPLGLATRVATTSGPELQTLASWLRVGGARVRVQYPGAWLQDQRIYLHHGHYLDRHLAPARRNEVLINPDSYEMAPVASLAALQGMLSTTLPPSVAGPLDRAASLARAAGLAAAPMAAQVVGMDTLAPLGSGAMNNQFRRRGLPAMHEVLRRFEIHADHAVFGHVHRAGPAPSDDRDEWVQPPGPMLHNTGSWVYEPLLLAGARPPHPYWPGGAVLVEDDEAPRQLRLLDDVPVHALQP